MRQAVHVSTMDTSTSQDRLSQWTVTPGIYEAFMTFDLKNCSTDINSFKPILSLPALPSDQVFIYFFDLFLMFVCHHSSCSGRTFTCTSNVCNAVCGIYGDGHYITFDDKRFDFSGECEYTLLQVRRLLDKSTN